MHNINSFQGYDKKISLNRNLYKYVYPYKVD